MADQNHNHVNLPTSVDNLIDSICRSQNQPPPDSNIRQQLALAGEELSLHILKYISSCTIRTSFSGFISHMLRNQNHHSSQFRPSQAQTQAQFQAQTLSISPSHVPNSTRPHQHLHALRELEFRKAFLILSYIGRNSLENFFKDAEEIRSFKDLPMATFEKKIWEYFGKDNIYSQSDRQLYADWDSGRTHIYQCYVLPDGNLRFKGPILQNTQTHLHRTLGDENVLLVKFAEDGSSNNSRTSAQGANDRYVKFGKEGIHVGLHLYRFFVFKDGGKEEKKKDPTSSTVKCYFVRMQSCSSDENAAYILSNKTVSEARTLFMHAHTLPSLDKYMARFSLILSKTLKLNIDLAAVNVETIDDVLCKDENKKIIYDDGKPRILTDGTGFISEDLALLCPYNVYKGRNLENNYIQEIHNIVELEETSEARGEAKLKLSTHQPPLLIQCRLFHKGRAIKGTLLVNKKLHPRTIQVRPSMIKVETDPSLLNMQSINSLEVVNTSNKPCRTYLSKYLIALLSYGGVPNEFFMDLLRSNLEEADHVYSNKRAALRASVNHGEMDEYIAAEMILCGIPLDEPFLQYHLSILAREEKKKLRGGRLYMPDCFYLMGTVDPTGHLEKNQVCIIHENGQITGDVLVYHNPGLHFGDIHKMHAVVVKDLESYVGHSKYAIFFPRVGTRSVADEIAGADFDGDLYWVSTHPQLLQDFRMSDPWMENSSPCNSVRSDSNVKRPSAFSAEELEEELFRLYLNTRFQPSYAIGVAADSWMALMDRFLTLKDYCTVENEMELVKENILKLIDIYYEALDAPKKGGKKVQVPTELSAEMFPHYMKKDKSFTSTSILGLIYDEVGRWLTRDLSGQEIRKLPCFDVKPPDDCLRKWEGLYEEYRKDMHNALTDKSEAKAKAAEVIRKYKQKLYEAEKMEDSEKSICDIYNEALAVYNVCYNYAIRNKSVGIRNKSDGICGFAWKVAGSALSRLYTIKQNQKSLLCAPSVLREIFGS